MPSGCREITRTLERPDELPGAFDHRLHRIHLDGVGDRHDHLRALGQIDGHIDGRLRIISARRATRQEQKNYEDR